MNIKIIDNFAPINDQLNIKNLIQGDMYSIIPSYEYHFNYSSVIDQSKILKNKLQINYPQFIKNIFNYLHKPDKTSFPMISNPVLFTQIYIMLCNNNLANNNISRIKINTTFPYPNNTKKNYGPIHIDNDKKGSISIIYYLHNTDGDTLFFNNNSDNPKIIKRVSPRQGRAVVFDSNIPHAGSCPINSPFRQVINFVLYK